MFRKLSPSAELTPTEIRNGVRWWTRYGVCVQAMETLGAGAFLTANGLVTSIASGLAPVLGGVAAHLFTSYELALTLRWRTGEGVLTFDTLSIERWDFFFLISALVGVLALLRLGRVREEGEVEEEVVLDEAYLCARRFLGNVSSVAGLRQAGEVMLVPWGRSRSAGRRGPGGPESGRRQGSEPPSEDDADD